MVEAYPPEEFLKAAKAELKVDDNNRIGMDSQTYQYGGSTTEGIYYYALEAVHIHDDDQFLGARIHVLHTEAEDPDTLLELETVVDAYSGDPSFYSAWVGLRDVVPRRTRGLALSDIYTDIEIEDTRQEHVRGFMEGPLRNGNHLVGLVRLSQPEREHILTDYRKRIEIYGHYSPTDRLVTSELSGARQGRGRGRPWACVRRQIGGYRWN